MPIIKTIVLILDKMFKYFIKRIKFVTYGTDLIWIMRYYIVKYNTRRRNNKASLSGGYNIKGN